ncbi:polygalacturonase protein [Spatholobus suberectus]|nr:polygalacturonase protein [Spatholobus suberectus]
MQRLITCILILGFVSPTLCLGSDAGTKMRYFNVMDYGARGDGTCDDSNAILSAWQRTCGAEGPATLVIPSGKIFLVTRLKLEGPCKAPGIRIKFAGKIVPPAMDAWAGDRSSWIVISYVNGLTIDASGGINIDGYGSTWWEKCRSCQRPTVLRFHACNGLFVNSLRMTNSPGAHISVNGCDDARFSQININAPQHSPNTDGFDIASSKNILIEDSTIGTGDDCIAINGGSSYIYATRVACGPGHGISIGSLGKNKSQEIVEEVYVRNCSFIGTTNGARIKTWPGGSGYARKITFEQIKLRETQNPIIIDQNYGIKSPNPTDKAVKVSEVTYRGFDGTSADGKAIDLKCSTSGCFNITLDQIHIVASQPSKPTYASCKNAHGKVGYSVPKVFCLSK